MEENAGRNREHIMMSDVRISPAQSREHHADLVAAIGGRPVDIEQWVAKREGRRTARQQWRIRAWGRRVVQALEGRFA
jgi:hypothetical protein